MGNRLYKKVGRRYIPVDVEAWGTDCMKPGEFRLTHCYEAGARRYEYEITPDVAAWRAAAMHAFDAMVKAIYERAAAAPREVTLTKKQREVVKRFEAEMRESGASMPTWWVRNSADDIAKAAIDAVEFWKARDGGRD
jgi:hypothetical protein